MNALPPLPPHFWTLAALCLLAFVVLWWLTLGAERYARRRVLRQRIETLGQTDNALEQAPTATRGPRYDIPSLLFIGDEPANLPALLKAAKGAPMIAVRTDTAADSQGQGQWYRTLLALTARRQRLPLNGVVLCVGAPSLLDGARAMEPAAARLRQRVDDAAAHLRLHLPVYIVVTGLEQLQGYEAVREALPPEVLAQAIGHRVQDNAAPGVSTGALFDELFHQITLRMHALRMALLHRQNEPVKQQAIHTFVEQVRAMQPGLHVLVHRVFDNAGGPWPPHWRGIYLTAAPSDNGAGAFVSDLFGRLLPADQPLARA